MVLSVVLANTAIKHGFRFSGLFNTPPEPVEQNVFEFYDINEVSEYRDEARIEIRLSTISDPEAVRKQAERKAAALDRVELTVKESTKLNRLAESEKIRLADGVKRVRLLGAPQTVTFKPGEFEYRVSNGTLTLQFQGSEQDVDHNWLLLASLTFYFKDRTFATSEPFVCLFSRYGDRELEEALSSPNIQEKLLSKEYVDTYKSSGLKHSVKTRPRR
jgi:hypothetical protein